MTKGLLRRNLAREKNAKIKKAQSKRVDALKKKHQEYGGSKYE